ncbi:Aste57867_9649 [Aphanomyces stellatus]|uniref:Aste57867_9649 protein n=1 Tax=Aphanomyces stellatus TaxID=120398 RepID=A0A485KNI3_9STRA|nr:hypothetical protein As57867_009611 [Aphanomyces stellatus]VFT86528.1 Aste57867_9649 [Aphanomyces stellatus]
MMTSIILYDVQINAVLSQCAITMLGLGAMHHVLHFIDSRGVMGPRRVFFTLIFVTLVPLGLLSYVVSIYSSPIAILLVMFGGYSLVRRLGKASGVFAAPPVLEPQAPGTVRFVCISDTHGKHAHLKIPPGDVLLHAGDFTRRGMLHEIKSFNDWLGTLPHKRKIVIAGNHELAMDATAYPSIWRTWHDSFQDPTEARTLLTNCDYLEHSATQVDGIRVFGSPYSSPIPGRRMAFNVDRGDNAAALWKTVPADTQVLLTHGPPLGILDTVVHDHSHVGDEALLTQVMSRIRPHVHVFGHIHESYGKTTMGTTTFFNAAVCTFLRQPTNPPWVFDLPKQNIS